MSKQAFPARLPRRSVPALVLFVAVLVAPPAARDASAVVLESQASCQRAISKAGRAYLTSTLKTLVRCGHRELLAPGSGACDAADVLKARTDAEAKFDGAVTKACQPLDDEALSAPRPAGLSLAPLDAMLPALRAEHDRLAGTLVDALHSAPASGGAPPDADAADCQSALDRAAQTRVAGAFKLLATSCQDREDRGRSVTGEVSRIVESCVESSALALDAAAAKILAKVRAKCSESELLQLGACPTLDSGRTVDAVTGCLLDRARNVAAAAIAAQHGRARPRVIGRLEAQLPGQARRLAASEARVVALDVDGATIAEADADANGRVELALPALERVTLCWERGGSRSCAVDPVDVGLETVFFGDRAVEVPAGSGEIAISGSVTRSDGTPCFEAATLAEFALRGGVRVTPTGQAQGSARVAVAPSGGFVVVVPATGEFSLHADCGTEEKTVDLGPSPSATAPVDIQMSNLAPTGGDVGMSDDQGAPVTDPATVAPGDTISLHASFTDDEPLEMRWEITRGDGHFVGSQGTGDDRYARGADVQWVVGGAPGIHQVTLWVSDGRGGLDSLVTTLGPISPGPVLSGPCLAVPKLQKILCGTGYTALVPDPAGGRSEFLSYKYRNPSRNSPGDACAYYNLIDPECIDLNCDGVVDPGTDPLGKCKRTTLGGWWTKNGFDPVTGLGADVVSAWYLNSNDLGFGREMHCRVTGWSSIIADRPTDAPKSSERLVSALRSDLAQSPVVAQWAKLFGLYPSTVACYVTNYTTDHCFNYPTNDPANADLAYQGQQTFVANPTVNPPNAYGTVAMEFGPVEGFGEVGAITKFFVYNGRTASGKRLNSANLDGCGPKSVPELCMTCHGGSWPGDYAQGATLDTMVAGLGQPGNVLVGIDANDTSPLDAGFLLRRGILEKLTREESGFSSFVAFDPDTYVFPAAASSASQAASIRKLNQLVLYAKPADPIRDLIKGWYGNNLVSGTFAPWRPTAWNDDGGQPGDESDLHDDVYALTCRGCHASHYSFASWAYFPSSSRVCVNGSGLGGGSPTMPHAKLTYLNLWKGSFPQGPSFATLENWYTASEMGFTSCD